MNWRWKARLAKVIAAFPMSDAIYYRVQRCVGSLQPKRYDPSERLRAAAKMVHWAEELGDRIGGRSFLEVGTGRTLDIPLALWLCGAARVLTVDLNTYLAEQLTLESVAGLFRGRASLAGRSQSLSCRTVDARVGCCSLPSPRRDRRDLRRTG